MSRRSAVEVTIEQVGARLHVSWSDGRREGGADFDEVEGVVPRWVGASEDLLDGADRRVEQTVLDELVTWATDQATTIGVYHADGDVEQLR